MPFSTNDGLLKTKNDARYNLKIVDNGVGDDVGRRRFIGGLCHGRSPDLVEANPREHPPLSEVVAGHKKRGDTPQRVPPPGASKCASRRQAAWLKSSSSS